MTAIDNIAREGVEIAAKATKGEWRSTRAWNPEAASMTVEPYIMVGGQVVASAHHHISREQQFANAGLVAHAGNHYLALCAAVLERGAEVERLRAEHEKGGKA